MNNHVIENSNNQERDRLGVAALAVAVILGANIATVKVFEGAPYVVRQFAVDRAFADLASGAGP